MDTDFYSCCFTGYRPKKFPFPLKEDIKEYINFKNKLTETVFELINTGCRTFYTGMAEGFDIIAAETVLLSKDVFPDFSIELICVIPFIEQSNSFSPEWKSRYNSVLNSCNSAILISDNYYPACFMKRNIYMVNKSDYIVSFFDGQCGGTKRTVEYAERKGRQIINLGDRL